MPPAKDLAYRAHPDPIEQGPRFPLALVRKEILPLGLRSAICHAISKRLVLGRRPSEAAQNPATFDVASYVKWRAASLESHFKEIVSDDEVKGRDILDLGCGHGDLCFYLADKGVRSITGIEIDSRSLDIANKRLGELPLKLKPKFQLAKDTTTIDLPDHSVDGILCFDVMEHVMEVEPILSECRRVLRPGGLFAIWWVPWWHPYGPHIQSLVPIPWAHVFFSDRNLLETCARIYDHPDFVPRQWDLDEAGKKKPNKWLSMKTLPGVNRLSMRRFEQLAAKAGFEIEERRTTGFGSGGGVKALVRGLSKLPLAREFFTAHAVYRLRTPGTSEATPRAAENSRPKESASMT